MIFKSGSSHLLGAQDLLATAATGVARCLWKLLSDEKRGKDVMLSSFSVCA